MFDKSKARLPDLCADAFAFATQIRGAQEPESFAAFRQRVDALLQGLDRDGQRAGVDAANIQLARYALVALIDEIVLSSHWALRQAWTEKPLQLEYFNEFTAGQGFYDRLDSLRGAQDPGRMDVLEVYAICLGLGFRGRYADMAGMEKLKVLRSDLANELRRQRGLEDPRLSAHWLPEDRLQEKVRKVPAWVVAAVCGGFVLLLFLIFDFLLGLSVGHFESIVGGEGS